MNSHKTAFLTAIALVVSIKTMAQSVPTPASAQVQAVLITGATTHLGNGQVIENSYIAFDKGKITFVGNATAGQGFPGHQVVNATGKHLYPGFIAPNTTLGLQEIEAVRATSDYSEIAGLNPNIRSIIAYNTDSEVSPTVRSMGVLLAEVAPRGGRISGTSSVVQLDAWNWEDAAYSTDFAIHLNWPNSSRFNFRENKQEKNEEYTKEIQDIEAFFKQAAAYHQNPKPATVNLRLEAMGGLFEAKKRLFVHTNSVQGMQEAVIFAEKFQLTPTIVGGNDAWMITDFLKEHNIAIVLNTMHRLPSREDEDVDQPFKTPAMLQAAGVKWCFSHEGQFGGFWEQRNIMFQAGQAIAYGLSYEDGVKGLTSSTAAILGIEKSVGSIEVGKDATIFISDGDALDMRTNRVTKAYINGRDINLDNKQEALYRRFQQKYKSK